ncbi:hypothetical protein FD11_GL000612 [Ligilactobacillus pobuzihii E100301 = KCTC 13174]|uniref:HTH cro/C1-type domain-containing protein n=2 Tax=Ligilactobacillus pobuzihii TaxID=449659 RepID=A0A0R2LCI0_9LACO|nr:hypothetical protein FD11_GL000612 [Ligilactobacillus pobuzihii E100301 = KCTC 13174]KRN99185.1 hypothetical protein IV66_GL001673 [Ligilactobacillus pobuzihii]
MTIDELAEASNSSTSFISKIELGKVSNLKINKLVEILEALDLSIQDVFNFPQISDNETLELLHYLEKLPEDKRAKLSEAILSFVSAIQD